MWPTLGSRTAKELNRNRTEQKRPKCVYVLVLVRCVHACDSANVKTLSLSDSIKPAVVPVQ